MGAIIRGVVALIAIPAALIVARLLPADRQSAANLVLWTLAGLFALRVLEPELVPYFLAPVLALSGVSAARGPWWRLATTCGGAVWLNWWLHAPIQGRWLPWLLSGCSTRRPRVACASSETAAVRRRSQKPAGAQTGTTAGSSSEASDGTCGLTQRALRVTSWANESDRPAGDHLPQLRHAGGSP